MKNNSYKIDIEIYIVFIVVIGVSVFNAIYSSVKISKNQEAANKIMLVDIPALQKLEDMNLLITKSEMYTTNLAYLSGNAEERKKLQSLQTIDYPNLKISINQLMKEWNDKSETANMQKVFSDFENLISHQKEIMERLSLLENNGSHEKNFRVYGIIEKDILPMSASLTAQLNGMILKRKLSADIMHNEMRISSTRMMGNVLGIAILIIVVVLMAAFYMSNNIIVPTMRLKNFILQMGQGEIPDINIKPGKNAVGQMIDAVHSLTISLRRTTHFAREIGSGNLSSEFKPSGEGDELGNALLQMRANLYKADEELKQRNFELNQKARELLQKNEINEQARQALSIKARELELNSKYKSEFLANMSHELRTPLNSVLILAKLLEENKDKNLSDKQTEYAGVIHKSGKDLLLLINDILDLSKIEAGKVEIVPEETDIVSVCKDLELQFTGIAEEKKIDFKVETNLPEKIKFVSDTLRLGQILKNLLSNAFKFTPSEGIITLKVKRPDADISFSNPNLFNRKNIIEFSVSDNGIGIPADKQALIFEAFQQADGSTSRSYGGTGLGLSISKMLVSMLGGEMQLISEQGKGCTFYVFLPTDFLIENPQQIKDKVKTPIITSPVETRKTEVVNKFSMIDDRNSVSSGDKILLIVEDDVNFANILLDVAHERNYKAIIATDGNEGLNYADEFNPSAIILDMQLPGMNGWSVLDKIKNDIKLNHIPVHVMSAMDRQQLGIDMGAAAYIRKPLDKKDLDDAFTKIDQSIQIDYKHVLLIEDVQIHREIVMNLLTSHHKNVDVKSVTNISDAYEILSSQSFDCIVLDLDLGNGPQDGLTVLEKLKTESRFLNIPVIIFTGLELDAETELKINSFSAKIISKNADSLDSLIKETDLFLHNLSEQEIKTPSIPPYMVDIFKNKTILLVDDDMRNIYALSNVLEGQGMNVLTAYNGIEAIQKLEANPKTDIVLMDIMMPEMDGYEAMQGIKKIERLMRIPIIALTAKAMVGDREKCIQCGASDYISKPVNTDQLFSVMRVWLYQG